MDVKGSGAEFSATDVAKDAWWASSWGLRGLALLATSHGRALARSPWTTKSTRTGTCRAPIFVLALQTHLLMLHQRLWEEGTPTSNTLLKCLVVVIIHRSTIVSFHFIRERLGSSHLHIVQYLRLSRAWSPLIPWLLGLPIIPFLLTLGKMDVERGTSKLHTTDIAYESNGLPGLPLLPARA